MASLSGLFNLQSFTDAGEPASGYRLYTYAPGTTTHKAAYTDAAESVPHTYVSDGAGGLYIALDARGELPAPLFLASGGYDIALKTPAGAAVGPTKRAYGTGDAAAAADAGLRADIADKTATSKGSGMVGHSALLDYPADSTGLALNERIIAASCPSLSVAFDRAISKGRALFLGAGTYTLTAQLVKSFSGDLHIISDGATIKFTLSAEPGVDTYHLWLQGASTSKVFLHGRLNITYTGPTAAGTASGLKISTAANGAIAWAVTDGLSCSGWSRSGAEINADWAVHTGPSMVGNRYSGLVTAGKYAILVGGDLSSNGNGTITQGYGLIAANSVACVSSGTKAEANDRYGFDGRNAASLILNDPIARNNGHVQVYAVNEDSQKKIARLCISGGLIDGQSRAGSSYGIWTGTYGASNAVVFQEVDIDTTVQNTLDVPVLVGTGSLAGYAPRVVSLKLNIKDCGGTNSLAVGGVDPIPVVNVDSLTLKDSGYPQFANVKRVRIDKLDYENTGAARAFGLYETGCDVLTLGGFALKGSFTRRISHTAELSVCADVRDDGSNVTRAGFARAAGADSIGWSGEACGVKTVADATATEFARLVVPNGSVSGFVDVYYRTADQAHQEATRVGQVRFGFARYPGKAVVVSALQSIGTEISMAAGSGFGDTQTTAFTTAVSGGVGADNIISIRVAIDSTPNGSGVLFWSTEYNWATRADANDVDPYIVGV